MTANQNRPRIHVGSAPGSLVKHEFAEASQVRIIEYDRENYRDERLDKPIELVLRLAGEQPTSRHRPRRRQVARGDAHALVADTLPQLTQAAKLNQQVTWINIDGLADIEVIQGLGKHFGLHSLALEDVVNVHQQAKLDTYDNNVYLVVRMPVSNRPFVTEQVSLFLLNGILITLQEYPGDCLNPVRARLAAGKGRIRNRGADYLAYAVIDAVIDGYFPVLDAYEQVLQEISDEIDSDLSHDIPKRLHDIRADLLNIRKVGVQHRDAVIALSREDNSVISEETQLYLRDCHDHITRLLESADTYREACGELRELYFAQQGQRTNDVMKVLTIIATIFIPMSFIAGVYGMNFDSSVSAVNMPELRWVYGYPFAICIMLATGGGLLFYLRRRGWL